MSDVVEKIQSRGHWDVAIRPEPFVRDRVSYDELDEILEGDVVRLRGWPVPMLDPRLELARGEDWIGQDIDAELVSHFEAWRFFTSGQFTQLRAVSADWRTAEESTLEPRSDEFVIEVWEILFYLTEVFELAARLALGSAGDDQMTVDVRLNRVDGRGLIVGSPGRAPFMTPHLSTMPKMAQAITVPRDELVAESRSLAVKMSRDFFLRFGWKPSLDQLADHQNDLTK